MRRSTLIRQRLTVVFLIGVLLLFSPLIQLFDRSATWQGIPLLYLYLFSVWAGLIAAMAVILADRND